MLVFGSGKVKAKTSFFFPLNEDIIGIRVTATTKEASNENVTVNA